jgi:hypothetical protein
MARTGHAELRSVAKTDRAEKFYFHHKIVVFIINFMPVSSEEKWN